MKKKKVTRSQYKKRICAFVVVWMSTVSSKRNVFSIFLAY